MVIILVAQVENGYFVIIVGWILRWDLNWLSI